MPEVSPELADKVLSADFRNLIKKVGDGRTLNQAERQMFLSMHQAGEEPQDLHSTRVNALLSKWISGSRLSAAELQEISHVLPATQVEKKIEGKAEDVAKSIGLSRRPFFRWMEYGKKYNDPLPCDNPSEIPSWYERMKARGEFRNKIPASVTKAIQGAKARPVTVSQSSSESRRVINFDADIPRGFNFEIEETEKEVARLRMSADDAYRQGDHDLGDRLSDRRHNLLEKLRRLKKDSGKISEDDEELTRKSWVREDLSQIITAVVTNLEFMADDIYSEITCQQSRDQFKTIYKRHLIRSFAMLKQSKFAPPLTLSADD